MIGEFFSRLESKNIDCIVYKSYEDIELVFQKKSVEMDVFVPCRQRHSFRCIAINYGFSLRKSAVERDTDFFYLLQDHRIVMIHAVYRIITGAKCKNVVLDMGDDLVDGGRYFKGVRVGPSKTLLYYHVVKYILLGSQKHWGAIIDSTDDDRVYVKGKMSGVHGIEWDFADILSRDARQRDRARRNLKRKLILNGLGTYVYLCLRHTADRIGTRVRWISNGRGFDIAFVGVDGSGKSSLSKDIQQRLSFLGCKNVLYLGPRNSVKLLSVIARVFMLAKGKLRAKLGKVTIYDRYFYDMVAYRSSDSALTRLVEWLIPKPTFVFYCHADLKVILARKYHHNPSLLRNVDRRYQKMFERETRAFSIDTGKSVAQSADEIMDILRDRIGSSLI